MAVDPDDLAPSDDELAHSTLAEGLKRLAVEPLDQRFHGKSSGVMLVQAAMNLKREFAGTTGGKEDLLPSTRRPHLWSPHPVRVYFYLLLPRSNLVLMTFSGKSFPRKR